MPIRDSYPRVFELKEAPLSNSSGIGIGIDVGSTSASVVVVGPQGEIREEYYVRTQGRPVETVLEILRGALSDATGNGEYMLVFTGSAGRLMAELTGAHFVNEVVAQTFAIRRLHPEVRSIIEIGGETTKLMTLADGGDDAAIEDFEMNSLCAAGTGSFLDQQATRLGLTIEEFGTLALKSENPPRIAGRCSVFAKSDMIHLQQIATPVYDIVAGLCYAVARNFKSNIARGKTLEGPVAFQGGVAANPGVRRGLTDVLGLKPDELVVPERCASMGAIGAVLLSRIENGECRVTDPVEPLAAYLSRKESNGQSSLDPLGTATAGKGASHDTIDPASRNGQLYLGIDVGSISTNLVVIDDDANVVARRYLMTAGRPIEAIRQGLGEIGEEIGDIPIAGVGTTGSGRYLAHGFIGGDVVRNEITAQATAAINIDPEVDTIFEIGGQDSKYISLQNGAVVDFEMNKVCAAGTGSFLEEQAERLGIEIKGTFGKMALGAESPVPMGERCTVFIESDLTKHQQLGARPDDIVAGLSYSIVHNYLNKVVGQRRVGERVFFQGGTAFNQGVVAAFEKVLGRPVTVPPHHDVTGAIGAAILARRENTKGHSAFKGFDLSKKKYTIKSFDCGECSNACEIRKVSVEGEKPIFYGSRCEKYEVDKSKKQEDSLPDLFAEREELLMSIVPDRTDLPADAPVIGIPRSLFLYEHLPFWKEFFSGLGLKVEFSGETSKQIIHKGVETVVAEFCFPIKVAHGHVLDLVNKGVKRVFLPSVIDMPKSGGASNSFNCPYVQAFPYTVRSAVDFDKLGVEMISTPIYFGRGDKMLLKSMLALGRDIGVSPAAVKKSLPKALAAQESFYSRLVERGKEILDGLGPQDRALVIVSRPYNGCDSRINLNLPQKLRQLGALPIPIDMMPWEEMPEEKRETEVYWKAGQRILQTARLIKDDPRLFAVYLTNFGCGPDSFISHFFEKDMGGKPYLQLEIDEHSADAGVVTRCEAFLDSLNNYRPEQAPAKAGGGGALEKDYQKRTVYLPYMSDHAYAVVGAFKACGVNAEMMEESDEETLEIGRKFTSGRECYPCILTTGDMIKTLRKPGFDPEKSAFFMPSGSGPCRFGQYHRLHRLILDELGFSQVPAFSPNQDQGFYDDLGMVDNGFASLGWEGLVAIDLLEKKLRETKPYEVNPGETEDVYGRYLLEVRDTVAARGSVAELLKRARRDMDAIPISKEVQKPVIGIVGEIYVRSNRFSNEHIITKIEELGGEVWMPPVSEWFFYLNYGSKRNSLDEGRHVEFLKVALKNWFQHRKEQSYYAYFQDSIRNLHEPSTGKTLDWAEPFIHRSYEGEAVLSVGKSVDYIHKGAAGIVNTIPFACMPGNIVTAVFNRFRDQHGGIPILNLSYDGQGKTNSQTRLETFMYQVAQYHEKIHAS